MKTKICDALTMLHKTNIPFVLIKSEDMFGDIDVLVSSRYHFVQMGQALWYKGYRPLKYAWWKRWQPANERFKQIWKKRGETDIHLHRHIAWGSVCYISGELVENSQIQALFCNYLFNVPSWDMAHKIAFWHESVENFNKLDKWYWWKFRWETIAQHMWENFSLVDLYFELEALLFDCVKMFVVYPLREKGVIK